MGRFDNWEPSQEKQQENPVDLRAAALGPKGFKINPLKTSRKRKIGDEEAEAAAALPCTMDHDSGDAALEPPPGAKRQRVEGEPYRTVRCCRGAAGDAHAIVAVSGAHPPQLRRGEAPVRRPRSQRHCRLAAVRVRATRRLFHSHLSPRPGRLTPSPTRTHRPPTAPQVSGKVWKGAGFKAGTYKSAIVGTTWEKKMAAKAARKQFVEHKNIAVESMRAKRKVGGGGGLELRGAAGGRVDSVVSCSTGVHHRAQAQAQAHARAHPYLPPQTTGQVGRARSSQDPQEGEPAQEQRGAKGAVN
jgi:hypothetical protein